MRLLHLCLFRNGLRAFSHLIGLRHSACPCCLHAATSFSTFEGSPYRWTCRGVFARLSIGVNMGWESRGARCVERGDLTEQGTAVSATGAVSPRSTPTAPRLRSVAAGTGARSVVTNTRHPFSSRLKRYDIACPREVARAARSPSRRRHSANFTPSMTTYLPCCPARQPQPQGQGTVAGNPGHAQLAAASLIPAPQHEELAAAGIPPTGIPAIPHGWYTRWPPGCTGRARASCRRSTAGPGHRPRRPRPAPT